jgi:hypothetical protein
VLECVLCRCFGITRRTTTRGGCGVHGEATWIEPYDKAAQQS